MNLTKIANFFFELGMLKREGLKQMTYKKLL